MTGEEKQSAYDRLKTMLRAMADRIADEPTPEPFSRQLSSILHSSQPPLSEVMQFGHSLVEAGLFDDALKLYRQLSELFPNGPQGLVGMAFLAMQKMSWSDALARWDELIARFPEPSGANWYLSRTQALLQLGRKSEAEEEFRRLVQCNPELLTAWAGLLGALGAQGKWEEAMRVLESSPCKNNDGSPLIRLRFDILLGLRRMDDARAEFRRLLQKNVDAQILLELFKNAPILYSGSERKSILLSLLDNSETSEPSPGAQRSDLLALRAQIFLALRDYGQFLSVIDKAGDGNLGKFEQALLAVASRLREASFPNNNAPKIFGIGLSRTGTTSLTAALSALNFRAIHWLNPLTYEMMSPDDLHLFDAFTDTPVCANFENYYLMFHNSKFIYTIRPFESWQRSMREYFRKRLGTGNFQQLKMLMSRSDALPYGTDFSDIHLSLYFNHENYEDAYRAYDRRVRRFFQDKPKARFLEFDVSASNWEVLCSFIGTPVPTVGFPWLNRSPQ